jgi:predicted nicotinamide N-methyase
MQQSLVPVTNWIEVDAQDHGGLFHTLETFPYPTSYDENYELVVHDNFTLFLTQAQNAFHGVTSDETGSVIWGAAVGLARHLTPTMVQGKRILELGCGGGAPSLVACHYGATRVVATDFGASALSRMDQHAILNDCPDLEVYHIDWENLPSDNVDFYISDVILAADVIYGNINVKAFVNTIDLFLAPGGTMYFSSRNGRQGVGNVLQLLTQSGFVEEAITLFMCFGGYCNSAIRYESSALLFHRPHLELRHRLLVHIP